MLSQTQTDAPTAPPTASKSGSKVLLTVLFVILALAILGGAVYYVGGVDYVKSLFSAAPPPAGGSGDAAGAAPTSTPAATSTPVAVLETELLLPPGVTPNLAKRMYVEQIQSQQNLVKMAEGLITRFDVTSITISKKKDKAAVFVTAHFQDGTSAAGVIQWVKPAGAWYFMSFTGLRNPTVVGQAETVQTGTIAEGEQANAKVIAESGVTVFDYGVINTMLADQTANQELVTELLKGSMTQMSLGVPVAGFGITSVPSIMSGKSVAPLPGEAMLIHQTVDYEDLTFLTSFRKK